MDGPRPSMSGCPLWPPRRDGLVNSPLPRGVAAMAEVTKPVLREPRVRGVRLVKDLKGWEVTWATPSSHPF